MAICFIKKNPGHAGKPLSRGKQIRKKCALRHQHDLARLRISHLGSRRETSGVENFAIIGTPNPIGFSGYTLCILGSCGLGLGSGGGLRRRVRERSGLLRGRRTRWGGVERRSGIPLTHRGIQRFVACRNPERVNLWQLVLHQRRRRRTKPRALGWNNVIVLIRASAQSDD